MSQTSINIRIDVDQKKEFELFCDKVGLTMTCAFNLFIKKTLKEYRIPFDIDANMPNAETLAAIKEVQRMKENPTLATSYTDIDKMFEDILK